MPRPESNDSNPGAFSQDFGGSDIRSGDGGYGGRGGDVGSYNETSNSNNVNNTTVNFYGPQFIVNEEGKALDLSMSNKSDVLSFPFHGGPNQQWLVQDDGNGGVALMSKYNKSFVAIKGPRQGSKLVSTKSPFFWNITKDAGGYKLTAPNSDLALSLSNEASLRAAADVQGTRLYILENTPENQAAIKSGQFVPPPEPPQAPLGASDSPKRGLSTGATINIIINENSGSGNATSALRSLENFLDSDGIRNLTLCLGHHQTPPTPIASPPEVGNIQPPSVVIAKPTSKIADYPKQTISEMAPVPSKITGAADIIGFGINGVVIMRNRINPQPELVVSDFGYNAGGWRVDRHVRLLADTTGDGTADIVGFGEQGVWVAINNGNNSFRPPKMVKEDFAYTSGQWRIEQHLRFLADLRNTGRADIIGFGYAGVLVSLNVGDGTFGPTKLVLEDFAYNGGGWRTNKHPRFLADITGNGLLDIVGCGETQVWVSLNKGNGRFDKPRGVLDDFCYGSGSWRVEKRPRFLADLTGDGKADLIGFGEDGVRVSLNRGDGTFHAARQVLNNFCYNLGWRIGQHPRFVTDLTGNGCADIIGFGNEGVFVAINNGNGTFQPPKLVLKQFGYNHGWRVEKHSLFLTDMTGDGKADIVGLGSQSVYVSYNDGKGGFKEAVKIVDAFDSDSAEWAMDKTVKYATNLFNLR